MSERPTAESVVLIQRNVIWATKAFLDAKPHMQQQRLHELRAAIDQLKSLEQMGLVEPIVAPVAIPPGLRLVCTTCGDKRRLAVGHCTCPSKIDHDRDCGYIPCPDCTTQEDQRG